MNIVRSLLPNAKALLPYLERIDKTRHYTNFGPLNAEYQGRISDLFSCPCITGSSATSLITATLMALDLPRGSLIALPSYTFPATAAAVVSAGHVPYFCDVDEDGALESTDVDAAAIIIVSPFGRPLQFEGECNVPIIIDAAAGFDAFSTICKPCKIPTIISTHATKAFGTGEGGLLFTTDTEFLEKVRRITNFGLTPERNIEHTGLNAKLSEYHAAVGLAELDGWPEKRKLLLNETKKYGIDYAMTQVPVKKSDHPDAKMNVYGCHIHCAYMKYPRAGMKMTNELIATVGAVMVGI